jgi:hypothetical protein
MRACLIVTWMTACLAVIAFDVWMAWPAIAELLS